MFEKVNPAHPDKQADRIAGALVDMAYRKARNPRIAVEVLIGHGVCNIICETSVRLPEKEVYKAVKRIAGNVYVNLRQLPQDEKLAENQKGKMRCGDNGIFLGMPVTLEQKMLAAIVSSIRAMDELFVVADAAGDRRAERRCEILSTTIRLASLSDNQPEG